MNFLNLRTEIKDPATLQALRLLGDRRQEINEAVGTEAAELTRSHLARVALEKHGTANRLGAMPTGHFKDAAESINLAAGDDAAELRISHRGGLTRAVRDVEIKPTGGRQFLTLPVHGLAYGRRVAEVQREIGQRLFRPFRRGAGRVRARALAARATDGGLIFLYALRESVFQDQDRELLPSDEEYSVAAKTGIRHFLARELEATQ